MLAAAEAKGLERGFCSSIPPGGQGAHCNVMAGPSVSGSVLWAGEAADRNTTPRRLRGPLTLREAARLARLHGRSREAGVAALLARR